LHVWTPSIAPCGMTMVTSDNYSGWKNNLLIGALVLQHVSRVEIKNKKVIHEERLLEGIARVRDVREAPDSYIYVLTENPGMFLRLIPVK
jgi:aldose sugar dehydrogenase